MMPDTPSALDTRLPACDPTLAEAVTAAISALRLHGVVDATITADAAETEAEAGAWFLFETAAGMIALAPLVAEGLRGTTTGPSGDPDAIVAADTLARLEPLVAAIETALALDLHPVDLVAARPPAAVVLDVALFLPAEQAPRHRALLALPDGFVAPRTRLRDPRPARPGERSRWTFAGDGPDVTVAALRGLARGDLVLLGIGPLRGLWTCAGAARLGRLDWGERTLMIDDGGDVDVVDREPIELRPEPDEAEAGDGFASVRLRTSVLIEGGEIETGAIAGLGAGSVVPLPLAGPGLPVRLLAGGTTIADGELIAVGEGYGVLVTSVLHDRRR